jgi:hypothetical protein
MTDWPRLGTTHLGSVPYTDPHNVSERLAVTLDIPAWAQFSRRSFRENMYVQFSAALPRVVIDPTRERIWVNTAGDLTPDLEAFYALYLEDYVDAFALTPDYAAGFFAMLDVLTVMPGTWAKGQVTGPVSLGLSVTDQDRYAILYHDLLSDVVVKTLAMNARWQVRQLRALRPQVLIFVDEPYLASFGSAYVSLERDAVIAMLNEVFAAIHSEGGLAGVHCCGNTDWSLLLDTSVDVLNLDAFGYLDALALYPEELRAFLDRGGVIAWGIVPNNETISQVSAGALAERLWEGLRQLSERAAGRGMRIAPEELLERGLLTPSCGLGTATPEIADQVYATLIALKETLL